jgi:peptidyl-Lys metalloendopeptidase
MRRLVLLLGWILLAAIPLRAETSAPATDLTTLLRATLAVEPKTLQGTDPVEVHVALENLSRQDLSILLWHTPLEGVWGDIFVVTHDGKPVAYRGPLAKRGMPNAADYLRLVPGKPASAVVDLAKFYAIEEPGRYTVQLRTEILDLGEGTPESLAASFRHEPHALSLPLVSREVAFDQVGRRVPVPHRQLKLHPTDLQSLTFEGCSQDQQQILQRALRQAANEAAIAFVGLDFLPEALQPVSPLYAQWFGAYDKDRYAKVLNAYRNISNALSNYSVDFDCTTCPSPNSSTIAYVWPDLPFGIYICGPYYALPDDGSNTKAGTIVHEMSHFNGIGNTVDLASGSTSCALLATRDPASAVQNADNYLFFADNFPHLPFRPGGP